MGTSDRSKPGLAVLGKDLVVLLEISKDYVNVSGSAALAGGARNISANLANDPRPEFYTKLPIRLGGEIARQILVSSTADTPATV